MNIKHESQLHDSSSLISKHQKYLREFVYGGIDGSITTFAVVAGAAGANLDASIIIILGFANLLADGFSMSVGSYLSGKSELENYEKHRKIEYWEIDNIPHEEIEEVRQIYYEKGFRGELLEQVVEVITADKDRWVNVMMKDELEMIKDDKSPVQMAIMTFISFVLVGLVPLILYVLQYVGLTQINNTFLYASILTSLTFIGIGWMQSYVNKAPRLRSMLETFILGAVAASVAYFVGDILEKWLL